MGEPTAVPLRAILDLFLAGSQLPVKTIEALIAGDEHAEDLLIEVVRSQAVRDESWAPVWALIALGERHSMRALPAILECMRSGTDLVHEAVEFALLRYGEAAVDPILRFLDDNPALDGRVHLYSVLAAGHTPRAIEYLIAQLRRDEDCVGSVAWALAETRDPGAVAAIEREAHRFGSREPELGEALEAARGTDDLTNPLLADWRTHWTFEEGDIPSEDDPEPETMRDEEDGLNLQPRYLDVHCPICESHLEYDVQEDQARVLRGGRQRRV
ncbi:MAG: hypothetical protein HYY16_05940 [Planctomycetes bacterium]|nr:hypothetical protein [Planctomycetota bacterium]